MKRKIIICIALILSLMFFEYRIIMLNLTPYIGDNGNVYIELFGNVDEYYVQ